mgnify:CR=1 FL=1
MTQTKEMKMPKIEMQSCDDFIGIYDTDYDTQVLIDWFQYAKACGHVQNRGLYEDGLLTERPLYRRDEGFSTVYSEEKKRRTNQVEGKEAYRINTSMVTSEVAEFNQTLSSCLGNYASHFREVAEYSLHFDSFNIQRTTTAQGYHGWHCEDNGPETTRKLVYMMYLNDGFQGGETEFLYQSRRLTPKKGQVVIWPASFTHTHRGNPPLDGEKYISTG